MTNRRDAEAAVLDRIEDRLRDAPLGLHMVGEPASQEELQQHADLDGALELWAAWDGLELGCGQVRIAPLAEHASLVERAGEEGLLERGDRVVGEQGREFLVVPEDPWEEGAGLVLIEEDGQRMPLASSPQRFVLSTLAAMTAVYDEEGEYQEDLIGEDGELDPAAERRMLRRVLDQDPMAPLPRFSLGRLLRRGGEGKAARAELRRVLKAAPEFGWARFELARCEEMLGLGSAGRSYEKAAESFSRARRPDPGLEVLARAHALRLSPESDGTDQRSRILELAPGFAAGQLHRAQEALEFDELEDAREALSLGLAVQPRNLELLDLKRQLESN